MDYGKEVSLRRHFNVLLNSKIALEKNVRKKLYKWYNFLVFCTLSVGGNNFETKFHKDEPGD